MDRICTECGNLYVSRDQFDEGLCPACEEEEYQAELAASKKRCHCGAAAQGIVCHACSLPEEYLPEPKECLL